MSEELYSMTIREAINKRYIVPIQPIFYDLDNSHIKRRKATGKRGEPSQYQLDYSDFIVKNTERNDIVVDVAQKMLSMDVPTLILVTQVEHGLKLAERLSQAVFANSTTQNPKKNYEMVRRFNSGEFPIMIGTSVIGEGVDTKRCGALINASGGKAKSELLQKVGRTVRNFEGKEVGFYFDFMDNRSPTLKKHSTTRKNTIKKEFDANVIIMDGQQRML